MAEPTPEEKRKEMAEVFADGLEIFESRQAERKAKEEAANPPKPEEVPNESPKSGLDKLRDFFLG